MGHFLRLRQAGPQIASDSIFNPKQRNLLDNSPPCKEAQSRIRQASTKIGVVHGPGDGPGPWTTPIFTET